jgi:RHS repeat-associated protein
MVCRFAFKYDSLGRRVQKVFSQGSTSTTTNYLYDGNNAVADVDQNANVLARYTATQNIDEPLAELRSSTTSYYSLDGLGSVTSLTTSGGALGDTYRYDSFGNATASSGSIVNRLQYTGRESDAETGLYFYRTRYYDPTTGRFLDEDRIAFLAGSNFYTYVENDPVGWADPAGQQKCNKSCGIKQGPEYSVSGTVPGGTEFTFHAEFLNDETHSLFVL